MKDHRYLRSVTTTSVVVLIGSGSIGRAIARRVATGSTLLVADVNKDGAERVAEQLRGDGYEVQTAHVDVSDAASVHALAQTAAQLGPVMYVIHAAGVSPVQASPEKIVEVDVMGTAYVFEEFGKVIAEGGSGIVVASQAGHMLPPLSSEENEALGRTPAADLAQLPVLNSIPNSGAAYALAKRANILRAQYDALAWGDRGARLNSISPGIVMTPLARDEMSGPGAEGYRTMIETSPAKRVATPDEIADAAAFMMNAPFITGTDLLIDGGVIATISGGRFSLPGRS